ncbi:MAG: hypothetical protein BGN92_03195 [Sphingobacteriales bacterium 41-5]|nr:MAG: hypothetical protein BGN92_03195 [Sphingobacteriales bacterium 41-5]
MASVLLDGSHTSKKRGGEAVGYQGRKSDKTTNSLYLSDNSGGSQVGEHNDLYEISRLFEDMTNILEPAGIDCRGAFLNADPGFADGILGRNGQIIRHKALIKYF